MFNLVQVYPQDYFGNPSSQLPVITFPNGTATVALQPLAPGQVEATYIATSYGQLPMSVNFSVPGASLQSSLSPTSGGLQDAAYPHTKENSFTLLQPWPTPHCGFAACSQAGQWEFRAGPSAHWCSRPRPHC